MSEDCEAFVVFCAAVGDEKATAFLEELSDMEWSGKKKSDRITVSNSHRHDACNYTHSGTVLIDGIEYGFVIDNGNWNGTVVREWGSADDIGEYQPPPPTIYTYVPADNALKEDRPALWGVYLAWREAEWFRSKERGYNYDRHFAPGGKTEKYYRDWAAKKGLKIVSQAEADEIINRPKRDLTPIEEITQALSAARGEQ